MYMKPSIVSRYNLNKKKTLPNFFERASFDLGGFLLILFQHICQIVESLHLMSTNFPNSIGKEIGVFEIGNSVFHSLDGLSRVDLSRISTVPLEGERNTIMSIVK